MPKPTKTEFDLITWGATGFTGASSPSTSPGPRTCTGTVPGPARVSDDS
jgi:hypothetical protein